ncbi:hypothetical protein D3C76_1564790 [compost metagenome]
MLGFLHAHLLLQLLGLLHQYLRSDELLFLLAFVIGLLLVAANDDDVLFVEMLLHIVICVREERDLERLKLCLQIYECHWLALLRLDHLDVRDAASDLVFLLVTAAP